MRYLYWTLRYTSVSCRNKGSLRKVKLLRAQLGVMFLTLSVPANFGSFDMFMLRGIQIEIYWCKPQKSIYILNLHKINFNNMNKKNPKWHHKIHNGGLIIQNLQKYSTKICFQTLFLQSNLLNSFVFGIKRWQKTP